MILSFEINTMTCEINTDDMCLHLGGNLQESTRSRKGHLQLKAIMKWQSSCHVRKSKDLWRRMVGVGGKPDMGIMGMGSTRAQS